MTVTGGIQASRPKNTVAKHPETKRRREFVSAARKELERLKRITQAQSETIQHCETEAKTGLNTLAAEEPIGFASVNLKELERLKRNPILAMQRMAQAQGDAIQRCTVELNMIQAKVTEQQRIEAVKRAAIEKRENDLIAARSLVGQLFNDAQLFKATGWNLYYELDTYEEYKHAFEKARSSLYNAYYDLNSDITEARNDLIFARTHFSEAIEGLNRFIGSGANSDDKAGARKEVQNVWLYIGRVNSIIEKLDNL